MRVFGGIALLSAIAALAGSASAQDVNQWQSVSGFEVGDEGDTRVNREGLSVGWTTRSSYSEGRMAVIGEFCNSTGFDWEGGMRLTHISPERGHLTLRVPARECVTREEIIPIGVESIYVLLDEY